MKAVLLILAGCLLPGCASLSLFGPDVEWVDYSFPEPLEADLAWYLAQICLERCELAVDPLSSSREEGGLYSIWLRMPNPFKGRRLRLHAELVEGEGEKVAGIRFYVEQQVNAAMDRRANPEASDWEDAGQDLERQARYLTHLEVAVKKLQQEGPPGAGWAPTEPLRFDR